MKRSIARKWAQALESGEYKQAQGALREGNKFCCLGVLCNIHAQEHPEIAALQKRKKEYMGKYGVLPIEVRDWASMNSTQGHFGCNESLICLNDNDGLTFPEIAKVIRKRWKEL